MIGSKSLLFLLAVAFGLLLVAGCGSGEGDRAKAADSEIEDGTDSGHLGFDETHQTWSTASRVLSELIEGAQFTEYGMMPIPRESERDFSSIFPEQLDDFTQSAYDPQMIDKDQYALVRLYERAEEKLLFTIYRFDTPLNMYNFFIALDSIYRQDPTLIADEIRDEKFDGWQVKDDQGKYREIGVVLDDYTFLQADANPQFEGDMMELIKLLQFED